MEQSIVGSLTCTVHDSCNSAGLSGVCQGKFEEAEPLYRRAMAITEATSGSDHPDYASDLGNLAVLLSKQVRAKVLFCSRNRSEVTTCKGEDNENRESFRMIFRKSSTRPSRCFGVL